MLLCQLNITHLQFSIIKFQQRLKVKVQQQPNFISLSRVTIEIKKNMFSVDANSTLFFYMGLGPALYRGCHKQD